MFLIFFFLEETISASFFFLLLIPFKKAAVEVCILKLICQDPGIKVVPFDMHKSIHECSVIVAVVAEK